MTKWKTTIGLALILAVLLIISGCGNVPEIVTETEQNETVEVPEPEPIIEEPKICVEIANINHRFEIDDWTASTYMVFDGEIINNCNHTVRQVEPKFIFFDKTDNVLVEGFLESRPINIQAGETARFQKILGDQYIVLNFDRYDVVAMTDIDLEGVKIRV